MCAMSSKSGIEWTEATWNPVTGCDRVSAGCDNCYALAFAARLKAMGQPKYQQDGDPRTSGPGFGITLHPDELAAPYKWREPRRIFVNSMSDLFHPRVPTTFIGRVYDVMAATPQHTYQILTKRPRRARSLLRQLAAVPAPNVWIGVSIEANEHAGRADLLRETPAAVRFLSCEPLLGPLPALDLTGIDWVIVGGESGPNARPMRECWAVDIRDLCQQSQVRFFFKQWGGRTSKAGGRLLQGRSWDEMPEALGSTAWANDSRQDLTHARPGRGASGAS
jgi:protein gp37